MEFRRSGLAAVALATALLVPAAVEASPFTLTNATGDGTVTVGVDGYGAFGLAGNAHATDAFYDPVGAGGPAATTFESYLAFGTGGGRTVLSGAALANPTVTGSTTSGSSAFTFGGLNWELVQTLSATFSGPTQVGSQLTQVYTISNPITNTVVNFDLVRYFDGDLRFDGSLVDGGGMLTGPLTLFETDSATGSGDPTTFVGIRQSGCSAPGTNLFEIDSFSGLRGRVSAGTALDDTITNDGGDADLFIDAGAGYDVTLALRSICSLAPGQSLTFTASTIWGTGAPQDTPGQNPAVPEPGTLVLMGTGVALLASRFRRSR